MPRVMLLEAIAFAMVAMASFDAWGHPGSGIVVDDDGNVFYVEPLEKKPGSKQQLVNRIVKMTPDGKRSVLVADEVGLDAEKMRLPHHLVLGPSGDLYAAGDNASIIWKITPKGKMIRFYPREGVAKQVIGKGGDPFTVDDAGRIYFVPSSGCEIRRISSAGEDRAFVGHRDCGSTDGKGTKARFGSPGPQGLHNSSFAWGPQGALYVTDKHRVRKVAIDGVVTTVAGDLEGGYSDGTGGRARFDFPLGLAVDRNGVIYVADYKNNAVRRIAKNRAVTTVHKTTRGRPTGVAISKDGGSLYVLEVDSDANYRAYKVRLHE